MKLFTIFLLQDQRARERDQERQEEQEQWQQEQDRVSQKRRRIEWAQQHITAAPSVDGSLETTFSDGIHEAFSWQVSRDQPVKVWLQNKTNKN